MQVPQADPWPGHRGHQPARGGGEAGQRGQPPRGHPGPPPGPHALHKRLPFYKPGRPRVRRGGPHAGDRLRGGAQPNHQEPAAQGAADGHVLRHADQLGAGPRPPRVQPAARDPCAGRLHCSHGGGPRAGLRGVPHGQTLPAPLHVSQEEPRQEGDRLLLLVQLGQVPRGAPQLYRPPGARPPRQSEAEQAHDHLLRVLPGHRGHPPVHGRGRTRARHPRRGLDRAVRPAGRPPGVHPPRGPHSARGRPGPRPPRAPARGAGLRQVPPQGARGYQGVRVPHGQALKRGVPAGEAHREELLSAQVRAGCVPVLRARLRGARAQGHLQRVQPRPPGHGQGLWLRRAATGDAQPEGQPKGGQEARCARRRRRAAGAEAQEHLWARLLRVQPLRQARSWRQPAVRPLRPGHSRTARGPRARGRRGVLPRGRCR
mmetsp:Transcript_11576/g.39529  ORF Transcript_11576/g.39529 Transcript_11576/m.39529 type:complete len:429 (+) Transcript_11576:592-1878(+)